MADDTKALKRAVKFRPVILILVMLVLTGGRAWGADLRSTAPTPGAQAETSPSLPPPMPVVRYVVEKGDTLWGLSRQWGVSVECIQAGNPDAQMMPGEVLEIPRWECRVFWAKGGELLTDLADYLRMPAADIARANRLREDAVFTPGQRVWIPLEVPANGVCREEAYVRTPEGDHWYARFPWPAVGCVSREFGSDGLGRHHGIDIAAPFGHGIICPRDGWVVEVGNNDSPTSPGLGTYIKVAHEFDEAGNPMLWTIYGHVSGFNVALGEVASGVGIRVRAGDVIGYVGNNGRSTGAHLHFEVWLRGRPQDPLNFLVGAGS